MATTIKHPNLQESLIIIGSAMAFTLENWEEFIKLVEMKPEEAEEVKPLYEHMAADMHAHIEINEMIAEALTEISRIFGKGNKNG